MEAEAREQARARIEAAYDPQLFRQAGRAMAEMLADHLSQVQASQGRVLNWNEPEQNVRLADAALAESDLSAPLDELVARFRQQAAQILQRGNNLHDPRYIGHQVPASAPIAALFDAVGSATNQVMAIYEMGPWATAVERAVIERLGQRIGWSAGSFAGLVTHGGSLANLTALLTARNVRFPDSWRRGLPRSPAPALVVHGDAHYSITRAAGALGLGTANVLRAELDEKRRIDPRRLDEQLAELGRRQRPIMAVVACACATPIGAFDPLDAIAEVCQRHQVWLHVDAAHGGAASFSQRHRHLLQGLDQADSFVWDAHKMMFVPALCAFVFYRQRSHRFETFQQDAPYLFDPSAPGMAEYDSGLQTVECTKRAAVYGLWGLWSLFGSQLFADMVDVTFDVARQFYHVLRETPDFEALHQPQCNIVAFRHVPEALRGAKEEEVSRFQRQLRRDLIQSGEFYIVQTTVDGRATLRLTVCNPLTTIDTMRRLLEALRRRGAALLAADAWSSGAEETRAG